MKTTSDVSIERALSLDQDDLEAEDGVEQEWREEIVKRALEVREGRVELVDGPASLQEVRERLQRPRNPTGTS